VICSEEKRRSERHAQRSGDPFAAKSRNGGAAMRMLLSRSARRGCRRVGIIGRPRR